MDATFKFAPGESSGLAQARLTRITSSTTRIQFGGPTLSQISSQSIVALALQTRRSQV